MSSFLYFSKERRDAIKAKYPKLKNTEISSLLGEQWRNASEEERRPHIEMELEQRKLYKVAIEEFNRKEKARKQRESDEAAAKMYHAQQPSNIAPLPPPPQLQQYHRHHHSYYGYGSSVNQVPQSTMQYPNQRDDSSRMYQQYPYGGNMTIHDKSTACQYFANPPTPINISSTQQNSSFRQSPPPIYTSSNGFNIDSMDENDFIFDKDIFT